MPEGDTLMWTARRLNNAIGGATITRSDLRVPKLATTQLAGRTVVENATYGKHLLQRFSGGLTLHSHLKMEGRWTLVQAPHVAPAPPSRARALAAEVRRFETGHTTRALLYTPGMLAAGTSLGVLDLLSTDAEATIVGHLGPDLLAPTWPGPGQGTALERLLAEPACPIGEALLDQRNVAGLGTFWISEILFLHKVLPWQPVGSIPVDHLLQALNAARELMLISGSTGNQHSNLTPGGVTHYVHARSGLPCLRCADTVRVAMIGAPGRERTLFSCPTCQGGYAPGDDRRPQLPLQAQGHARSGKVNRHTS